MTGTAPTHQGPPAHPPLSPRKRGNERGVPLADSMRRAGALSPYFHLPVRPPLASGDRRETDGWIDATALFLGDDARLRDLVMAHGRETWLTANNHVAGSAFISAYLARLTLPVIAQFVLARRVPRVSLDNVSFHWDGHGAGHRIDATALDHPFFAALPSDPAATHPDAQVVPDEASLYARLKEWLFDANLDTVIPSLHRAARASVKVSRNAVAASCSQAFRRLYEAADDPEAVARDARIFFQDRSSPVYGQVAVEIIEHQGKRGFFSRRAGCCLWWRSPKAMGYCSNCVLVPHHQQDQRFREMLLAQPDNS